MPHSATMDRDRIEALRAALPGVELAADGLELYASDIFYESEFLPVAVAVPASAAEVQAIVRVARQQGLSLAVRGAGLSYSGGYIPSNDRTLVVDTTRMDRIVEINARDRHVTVEAGVTWAALHEALKPTGLTLPFWGTLSGRHATVGSALSQGAKLYGSGCRGTSAETVIGLKVVTGTGDLVTTGSAASIHRPSPFFRNYGPDLTGLFLGDCGAFGIKVEATLQLIPAPEAVEVASFSFAEAGALLESLAAIGSETLATECLALDPHSARARLASQGLAKDLEILKTVATASASPLKGLKDAVSVAVGGRSFVDKIGYLMNCVTEGRNAADARSRMARVREIARQHGGEETRASVPRVMRANPFPEISGLLTPNGRRINWLHTAVPNSRATECFERTEEVYRRHAAEVERFKIGKGYFLSANGPSGIGIETLITWSDAPLAVHRHYMRMTHGEDYRTREADPEARRAVARISKDLIREWSELGGVHLQIGRKYPFWETREPATRALVAGLKSLVDPDGIMSPGNLVGPGET